MITNPTLGLGYWLIKNKWVRLHSADVVHEVRLLSQKEFEEWFTNLPPHPGHLTSADVDTEADLHFVREEEAKKFYSKAESKMVEATAARIKKVAAEARKAKAKR